MYGLHYPYNEQLSSVIFFKNDSSVTKMYAFEIIDRFGRNFIDSALV